MSKLSELINEQSINKSAFCRKIKISRPTLNNLLSDNPEHKPSPPIVKKVCKALGVNWKDYV